MGKNVLISGASIAGPALAYWLGRYGFHPTVVELAPALREGGQAVDFRGETHLTVLERMGVLDQLRRLETGGRTTTFVDPKGRQRLHLPAEFTGGDIEVLRGDLSRVLYEASLPYTEYVFGDSVTGTTETATGVQVTFRHGAPREFDLVIGADGLHSNIRRIAFGPERDFVTHLGYYAATWKLPNHLGLGRETVGCNTPGRLAQLGGGHRDPAVADAFVVFAAPELTYDRHDLTAQKALIAERFAGIGWQVPAMLESLESTSELYFDSISRADVPVWHRGRTALVGDAACGATIGGMGTGTGVVAAYVLAGELARAAGDHRAAFAAYEGRLREYAQGCQQGGDRTGKFLAPGRIGGRLRDAMLNRPALMTWMLNEAKKFSTVELPDYPAELGAMTG
ncbi:2-polyprenyl-6-methoxyphenol hydroxylase-like FAD-dependent oxidoreductase [Kitasatospora gansuensis]|uniref:2-polyprenyl-6-methoxyphenol hydroxylase-like FAD-dependent oxidoreductase n=1 Tax=Kitasatospora gansuensis TaxID=258050 RepID=A0A7W7SB98_9ACTN|nr:FAD-dependent monooxygenase [Kitasatospora gansuensis]MBB4947300.1 2-polyprenyl-6-methoxyphenol hydroxylase-like FAD-dependent oxidoreductase [Kitasatospora gansuensis]